MSLFYVALAALSAAFVQSGAPADPYQNEPLVIEQLDTSVRMHADGTGETTTHLTMRVQSEGVARQFSVLTFSYASANETGAIDFVRVHKPDGTTVETPIADAMEMPSEVTRNAPMYSDVREKHLPVRSLAVGDRLDYQFRTVRTKAEAPNQFWGAEHFMVNGGVVLNQTLSLAVPTGTYVQVWSPNHPAAPTTTDGMRVWKWTSSQAKPSQRDANGKMTAADVKDPDEDSDGRKLPSVAWTTFHSWGEVGVWYRGLAESRIEPTDAIRAKAAELTKDAATPQQQVEALYRYVSTQTRYIGIDLGVGRYQPHAAAEVMANQYGDCKDKDTLLESLLRAKGFTTAPALIGVGIIPVQDVPSPAVFNHVITTVELPGSGRIWLDSTPEVEPYRVLIPGIRDQQALVVPSTGAASLQKTPADPPFPYKETFDAVATLDSNGVLKGRMELTVRSDNEFGYRSLLRQISPAQWDDSMQYLSGVLGFGGKVSHADLKQQDSAGPVHLAYEYTREDYGDFKNNHTIPLFPVLEVTVIDKDKQPEHDIDLGAPRTLEARTTITLPRGDRAELPEAVHVKRDYITFDKTYRLSDGKLIMDRTVVVRQHKVPKAQWKDYLSFMKAAGLEDGENYITLIASPTAANGKALSTSPDVTVSADAPKPLNLSFQQLLAEARTAERAGDWPTARRKLNQAQEMDPDGPYLMSMLGYIASHDGKADEAIADYRAELQHHPDASGDIIRLLAIAYVNQKRLPDAINLLKQYSSRKDVALSMQLAGVQTQAGEYQAALTTLQQAAADHPEDRNVQTQIVAALKQLHRNDEAAAVAKKAIDGSDDANLINSNVYLLAEMKTDLPFAETNSRRSVDLLEKATASYPIEGVNTKAFIESSNLSAAWDTLGDILLLEGKPAEAIPYLEAAWFNEPDVAVGDHLGKAYEQIGRKGDALRIDRLAMATDKAEQDKTDFAEARSNADSLEKAGVKASGGTLSLQDLRTYHLTKPSGISGGGTVRIQLGSEGVTDALLVAGDASLKPLADAARKLPMPGAVPHGSHARILRDAVVYCGKTSAQCDFVFMPNSGIQQETAHQ